MTYTDILFTFGAFLNASLFAPQIVLLYKTKKTTGLSLPMFLGFNMIQFVTALRIHGKRLYINAGIYVKFFYLWMGGSTYYNLQKKLDGNIIIHSKFC